MEINEFINRFHEAFTERAELPIAFWYSDRLEGELKKTAGCMFKAFREIRDGKVISVNAESIGCGGGKFYAGFTEMSPYVPTFVSLKEKYRKTPEMVTAQLTELNVPRTDKKYLHFARLDKVESFEELEALIFLVTPDILSGLATWAFFDNGDANAVSAPFGSGCNNTITRATIENRKNGKSCIIGFFDPSVRPYFESNLLSFTIPMSRFKEMYDTMPDCCLYGTNAWGKIKERIGRE
jgi:hypothetical protein